MARVRARRPRDGSGGLVELSVEGEVLRRDVLSSRRSQLVVIEATRPSAG